MTVIVLDPPPDTLAELRAEVKARGFDHLANSRIDRFINDTYLQLVEEEAWPFRETTVNGVTPLEIGDLGVIQSVTLLPARSPLRWEDRRTLLDLHGDLTSTGEPCDFYIEDGGVVKTWPVKNGAALEVRLLLLPQPMTVDGERPILPKRYCDVLITGACRRAYLDCDNWEMARELRADYDAGVLRMRNALLVQQIQDAPRIHLTSVENC